MNARSLFFTSCVALVSFAACPLMGVELTKVTATVDKIVIQGEGRHPAMELVELAPYESTTQAAQAPILAKVKAGKRFTVSLPRFAGEHDRLYSGFMAVTNHVSASGPRYVEEWKGVAKYQEAYPTPKSKKGLQVQMVDDAIALGVKHAALNFNLGQMVALHPKPDDFAWKMDGQTYHFHKGHIEAYDAQIKKLSENDMLVTLILLNYEGSDPELKKILLHPHYDFDCPEHLSAFNTSTAEGLGWFKAAMEFLANRYSDPAHPHGRVVNYIIGNEVNSHWWWANMGHVTMEQFADDYLRTVRVSHAAVRKFSSSARVFVSLEHHWTIKNDPDATKAFGARPFLDYFGRQAKAEGDFGWNLAFHPYPENLFECRTWNDKSAKERFDTPRITFKNIDQLPRYFERPELLVQGKPRHIILSEQGFHSNETAEGETNQAAAYCYAYYKVDHIPGIDSFILHRQVDHGAEGGLNLGLWRRNKSAGSLAEPSEKKPIYDIFKQADTPQWKEAFAFALPVIGIKSWSELDVKQGISTTDGHR